jgi:integrase
LWWGRWDLNPGSHAPQACILVQARRRPLSTVQRPRAFEGKIINTLLKLKSLGKAEKTLTFTSDRLKYLSKFVDLDDAQAVCVFIAAKQCENSYKDSLVKAYVNYAKFNAIEFEKPHFRCERKLPRIPSTEALLKVISASPRKYATIFKILMETGVMPFELSRVSLKDIDLDRGTLSVQGFKGHNSRAFKLKAETHAMLKEYIQMHYAEFPFPDSNWMGKIWRRIRNRVAQKLKDPNIKSIRLYDLRHYYATMLYHRTKDILLVKQQLGHKKIETTLIYTQLVRFSEDEEYCSATAKTIQEAQKLIEQGFEYVTEIDSVKLFRKRK